MGFAQQTVLNPGQRRADMRGEEESGGVCSGQEVPFTSVTEEEIFMETTCTFSAFAALW